MTLFTLLEFIAVSIPEEFLMVLFAWVILNKTHGTKFRNVAIAAFITAFCFRAVYIILFPDITLSTFVQVIVFTMIIYFMFKLNFLEAVVGSLLTTISFAIIQAAAATVIYVTTGHNSNDLVLSTHPLLMVSFVLIEFSVIGALLLLLYKNNIKIFSFKKKKINDRDFNKIRYLVLQMTFALLIVVINCKIFFYNKTMVMTNVNKTLIIVNFSIIILFSILTVKSVFSMGESIQKEEELKRELDGREIIQNIDYLYTLIESNKYDEVKTILKSIKDDVDTGMINNGKNNGVGSVK